MTIHVSAYRRFRVCLINSCFICTLLGNITLSQDSKNTIAPLYVKEAYYGTGGNQGNYTVEINGDSFDRSVTAQLVDDSGLEQTAIRHYYIDSSKLYATLDLSSIQPGTYHVNVRKQTTDEVFTIKNCLNVVEGGRQGTNRPFLVNIPSSIRRDSNQVYSFGVFWVNTGINDAVSPLIKLRCNEPFSDEPNTVSEGGGLYTMTFYGLPTDGPLGLLRPGKSGMRTFYIKPQSLSNSRRKNLAYSVDRLYKDPDEPFDWESIKADLSVGNMSSDEFELSFQEMKTQVGPLNSYFLRMLSKNANLLPNRPDEDLDYRELIEMELMHVWATLSTSIKGHISENDIDFPIAGRLAHAVNIDTGDIYTSVTQYDGGFLIPGINPGQYLVSVISDMNNWWASSTVVQDEINRFTLARSIPVAPEGLVLDEVTKSPISGAIFILSSQFGDSISYETQSNGRYALDIPYPGIWSLNVSARGYNSENDYRLDLYDEPASTLDISLQASFRISGVVYDAQHNPVEAAIGFLGMDGYFAPVCLTNKQGECTLYVQQPGQIQLVFGDKSLGWAEVTVDIDERQPSNSLDIVLNHPTPPPVFGNMANALYGPSEAAWGWWDWAWDLSAGIVLVPLELFVLNAFDLGSIFVNASVTVANVLDHIIGVSAGEFMVAYHTLLKYQYLTYANRHLRHFVFPLGPSASGSPRAYGPGHAMEKALRATSNLPVKHSFKDLHDKTVVPRFRAELENRVRAGGDIQTGLSRGEPLSIGIKPGSDPGDVSRGVINPFRRYSKDAILWGTEIADFTGAFGSIPGADVSWELTEVHKKREPLGVCDKLIYEIKGDIHYKFIDLYSYWHKGYRWISFALIQHILERWEYAHAFEMTIHTTEPFDAEFEIVDKCGGGAIPDPWDPGDSSGDSEDDTGKPDDEKPETGPSDCPQTGNDPDDFFPPGYDPGNLFPPGFDVGNIFPPGFDVGNIFPPGFDAGDISTPIGDDEFDENEEDPGWGCPEGYL